MTKRMASAQSSMLASCAEQVRTNAGASWCVNIRKQRVQGRPLLAPPLTGCRARADACPSRCRPCIQSPPWCSRPRDLQGLGGHGRLCIHLVVEALVLQVSAMKMEADTSDPSLPEVAGEFCGILLFASFVRLRDGSHLCNGSSHDKWEFPKLRCL